MATKPRIKLPESAKTGEVIEVKALVTHVMETGNRKTPEGQPIPRNILHTFKVTFDGMPVFDADWGSGVAANPFIGFYFKVPGPGTFAFTWIGDTGETIVEQAPLSVI